MAYLFKKSHPNIRVQISLAFKDNKPLKVVLSTAIPLVLSWVPLPQTPPSVNCPPPIVQPSNADINCNILDAVTQPHEKAD